MELEEIPQSEENKIDLSDKDIFTKIWTSPRLVFQFLNENYYDKNLYILMVLAGISSAFSRASDKNMGDDYSLLTVLAICIIFGGLLGWLSYYIYAALLSWTGKWISGEGDTNSLLRMISYAMLPGIASLVLVVPEIAMFGNEIFQSNIDIYSSGLLSAIVYFASSTIRLILGIWVIVLLVVGISEVQKLSIGMSILNMILPILVIVLPIALVIVLASS